MNRFHEFSTWKTCVKDSLWYYSAWLSSSYYGEWNVYHYLYTVCLDCLIMHSICICICICWSRPILSLKLINTVYQGAYISILSSQINCGFPNVGKKYYKQPDQGSLSLSLSVPWEPPMWTRLHRPSVVSQVFMTVLKICKLVLFKVPTMKVRETEGRCFL